MSSMKSNGNQAAGTNHVLTPETKRDEFRRYLEKTGIMDALTRCLVSLYEEIEKPDSPIEFFIDHLAAGAPMKAELEALRTELNELQPKFAETEEDNKRLRLQLEKYEPTSSDAAAVLTPAPEAEEAEKPK